MGVARPPRETEDGPVVDVAGAAPAFTGWIAVEGASEGVPYCYGRVGPWLT